MNVAIRTSLAALLLTLTSAAWSDWRQPEPANLLYMQLPQGEVVMELAPGFAPKMVTNIRILAREHYFDGLAIVRSQDNYVAQWADPADEDDKARSLGSAATTVPPEFQRPSDEVRMTTVASRDAYADIVGFVDGFPAASDGRNTWLVHCYGMVGVARGNEPDSGNGSSLYVVTGHAPRHLDRNITLVGRVISGIEHLTTLPRGTAAMGFYTSVAEMTPIVRMRLGDDVAEADRLKIEIMRTDSDGFSDYVKSRTTRTEEWFVEPTGRIEICNIHPPVREIG
ncbi:MAG: peptidylprolyl isomerase [Gammaproteobacteria bacterium]|nr:peptidylprolyl isomerase [Gammaproteobacteria bacterium]